MTNLDRLLEADGKQGGTIHDYNRRFGVDCTHFGMDDWTPLAKRLSEAGQFDAARLALAVARTYFVFAGPKKPVDNPAHVALTSESKGE